MWPDIECAKLFDELSRIIATVRSERDGSRSLRKRLDHLEGRQPLGMARNARKSGVDQ